MNDVTNDNPVLFNINNKVIILSAILIIITCLYYINNVDALSYKGESRLCLSDYNNNVTCYNQNGTFYLTANSYVIELYPKINDLKDTGFIYELLVLFVGIVSFILFALILIKFISIIRE